MAGITTAGFTVKTLREIKAEIENTEKSSDNFGTAINVNPQEPLGIINAIFAERESELWLLASALYNSRRPSTAEGQALDDIGSISGVTRLPAIASTVTVQLIGTASTVVPAGTIFSVSTDPAAQFATDEAVTMTIGDGSETANCTALNTGAVVANAGTLTVVDTPVLGLDSITNPDDAVLGRNIETDVEYRIRRNANVNTSKSTTLDGIRARIIELNDDIPSGEDLIEHVIVYENDTDATVDGRPPNSLEVYVYQTSNGIDQDQLIADTLFLEAKPAGSQLVSTSNTVTKSVTDITGRSRNVVFSRLTEIEIYLTVNLTTTDDFGSVTELENAILDWGNALGPAQDVIVFGSNSLSGVLSSFAGISDYEIFIDTAPIGGGSTDDNIAISLTEFSIWSSSRINLNP